MGRATWRVLLGLWLVAGVVTWNAVFDAHVRAGAREYVDRQELFVQGRGARADMDAVMNGAVSSGLRAATGYTLLLLAPAVALAVARSRHGTRPQGRQRHHP